MTHALKIPNTYLIAKHRSKNYIQANCGTNSEARY
jgi:hypothetical protein